MFWDKSIIIVLHYQSVIIAVPQTWQQSVQDLNKVERKREIYVQRNTEARLDSACQTSDDHTIYSTGRGGLST